MKNETLIVAAAAVLSVGFLLTPPRIHAAKGHFNISTHGDATSCAELRVTSAAEIAQINQSFTLSKGEAPLLEINSGDRGQIRVTGWDHADYSVETCKVAVADTRAMAD